MTAQDNSGVPSWCRVGAKVVCVDNARLSRVLYAGAVYTVTSMAFGSGVVGGLPVEPQWIVELREIANPTLEPGQIPGFFLRRFRPAVPPKTEAEDVSQFTHLLSGVPVDA